MTRWMTPMIVLALAGFALANTYVTPEEAAKDPQFAVQGEYAAQLSATQRLGAHVIALGDGKYRLVLYKGGLPGAGWDGKEKVQIEGDTVDGVPTFKMAGENETITIKDGQLHSSQSEVPLNKVERKSDTLGKKAPEGAIVLFDGSEESVAHWTGKGAKLSPQGHLQQGIVSKKTFQDHTVHIEFRLPYKPKARGQGRGNSGIYVQGRYEVQMLDSFGLEGKQNECGGIYSVGAPLVNMCYPPLSWQTYDIDFTAARYDDAGKKTADARLTVYHNGVKIHDDIVADHATTASKLKEGPQPGPVYLQDHGNPVRYRNIWVLSKN